MDKKASSFSLNSRTIKQKLVIAFQLMTILPLLVSVYLVSNYIFPLKDGEDCAIAYVKQPDALQAFKIMRSALESTIEAGRILVIKSQLIRELEGKQISDKRFMDVEGKYLPEDSNLNLGLMLAVNDLIEPTRQYFKKNRRINFNR